MTCSAVMAASPAVSVRKIRGPSRRPDQQVCAREGNQRGQQQRKHHLEKQGSVNAANAVPADSDACYPCACQPAHQGMR